MSVLGQALRVHRTNQGLTQDQLAEKICSVAYLSKLENGKAEPDRQTIESICRRLSVSSSPFIAESDSTVHKAISQWLYEIHIFHITEVDKQSPAIFGDIDQIEAISEQCLYDLALLGYYLLKDRLLDATDQFDYVQKRVSLYLACDAFSYYKFTGLYYQRKGMYSHAIEQLEEANSLTQDQPDAELYLAMAAVYSQLSNIVVSNKYAQLAFAIFQEKLFYVRMIDCQIVLGLNYSLVGDFYSAETYFNQLLEVDGEHLLDKTRANIYHHIGYIHFRKQEYEQAKASFNTALRFDTIEMDFLNSRYWLAYIAMLEGDHQKAKEHIQNGLLVAYRYEHPQYDMKFRVLNYRLDGREEELMVYLEHDVIPFFEKNGEAVELKHYYYLYGTLLFERNKYKRAAECFKYASEDFLL
ncbi:XRE family transcriptional regulator [Alkalibacillus salilacus]|uniref:Transcriptional regulator with XRE-family HTH domain/Tfp pilus assembly protein PilF n=1 Tax=Alkalibacillus salilacus TaxID=284582 RepID=A0ABT9VAS2_9BACI|nr:XRE family transcriptional regulator [Alkalibacillus salilacus]MDQ0158061.1 transcriptional regulator with XRE-family HTH domain/Tfp pilus assembly protein PilF [Alkalibacillus salilacus]